MNIVIPEYTKKPLSFKQQYDKVIDQTNEGVLEDLEDYSYEYEHMKYFIENVDWDDEHLSNWEQYLRLTLNSMSWEFKKFLERFHVNRKLISDYLKKNLYDKILEEFAKIPDFTELATEKLQAI
jgi:hypothetical protein